MNRVETRLLAVGDMHLGRAPARVPAAVATAGRDAGGLGPAGAWSRVVDFAVAQRVAAVVFAGDLVESSNARIEAWGLLERGVRRLADAGIPAVAVAGNHDVDVLPRLAARIPGLYVLGGGGRWEQRIVGGEPGPPVRIVGWSHPGAPVHQSPLDDPLPPAQGAAAVSIGLLHADLDQPRSRYAPVSRRELQRAGCDLWLLGHVHQPSLADGADGPRVGYLGSVVGLDRTETGRRGPWLLRVDPTGRIRLEHQPLAPLRWEDADVAVDDLHDPVEEVEGAVFAALRAALARIGPELGNGGAVGVSVRLSGRCRDFAGLRAAVARLDELAIPAGSDRAGAFVAHVADATRPARDLAALARTADPPGLLARRLLDLETRTGGATGLLDRARAVWRSRTVGGPCQLLALAEPDEETVRAELLDAGYDLLERLLAGAEGDDAPA